METQGWAMDTETRGYLSFALVPEVRGRRSREWQTQRRTATQLQEEERGGATNEAGERCEEVGQRCFRKCHGLCDRGGAIVSRDSDACVQKHRPVRLTARATKPCVVWGRCAPGGGGLVELVPATDESVAEGQNAATRRASARCHKQRRSNPGSIGDKDNTLKATKTPYKALTHLTHDTLNTSAHDKKNICFEAFA